MSYGPVGSVVDLFISLLGSFGKGVALNWMMRSWLRHIRSVSFMSTRYSKKTKIVWVKIEQRITKRFYCSLHKCMVYAPHWVELVWNFFLCTCSWPRAGWRPRVLTVWERSWLNRAILVPLAMHTVNGQRRVNSSYCCHNLLRLSHIVKNVDCFGANGSGLTNYDDMPYTITKSAENYKYQSIEDLVNRLQVITLPGHDKVTFIMNRISGLTCKV